jgi:GT2 family glycosyltransferase
MNRTLTWAMGFVTYRRDDTLPTAIRLAAKQTRPPAEVIVVDASPETRYMRGVVMDALDETCPAVPIRYIAYPDRPSIPGQRNYLLNRIDADIVFLMDDDSYMESDCAEAILRVYEADATDEVSAVAAKPMNHPPASLRKGALGPVQRTSDEPPARRSLIKMLRWPLGRCRAWVRHVLQPHNMWVPYDGTFPPMKIPESVADLRVNVLPLMEGFTMTVRREAAVECGYEGRIRRGGEDLDFSNRLARNGVILRSYDARVYHAKSASGRKTHFQSTRLEAINPLFCHRVYSSDARRSERWLRRTYVRRTLLETVDDLYAKRWTVPKGRAYLKGLAQIGYVMKIADEKVDDEWRRWQAQVLGEEAEASIESMPKAGV